MMISSRYRAGADTALFILAALALIGYIVLVALNHTAGATPVLQIVGLAITGGAGVAVPRGITRALSALTGGTEPAPARGDGPAPAAAYPTSNVVNPPTRDSGPAAFSDVPPAA